MRTVSFFCAILLGKFIRFLVWAIITIVYGPTIMRTVADTLKEHMNYVMASGGILLVILGIWITRKIFDRRKGIQLPVEDE
jgi:membrane protein DedA with SNARE-associated domain